MARIHPHTNLNDNFGITATESEAASPAVNGISKIIKKIGVGVKNMKMFLEILLLTIAVIILILLFFSSAEILLSPSSPKDLGYVCIRENCFSVEIAKTEAQREKGLMNRKELDKDKGMLFVFEKEGIYSFWMKNTLIPLDIIWIDSNNKIVFISQNVQPCKSLICPSIVPQPKVPMASPSRILDEVGTKYVLEINAGISEEIDLKLGDELKINY